MKKLFLTIAIPFSIVLANAQTPDAFNYQAVARNNAGLILPDQLISLRLTIHDVTPGGATVYSETDTATTNQFGLFAVQIGRGAVLNGTLSAINWGSADKYLQVEFDPNGGNSFVNMGTSQLISVPYAKVADKAKTSDSSGIAANAQTAIMADNATYADTATVALNSFWNLNGNNINNTNSGLVGIGTSSPASLLDVEGSSASGSSVGLITAKNTGTGNAIYATGVGTITSTGAVIRGVNTNGGTGVEAEANGTGWALFGYNPSSSGAAGNFTGNVLVNQGKLGVGTTTPDGAVTVVNNAAGLTGASIHTTNNNVGGVGLYCQTNGTNATAVLTNSTGSGGNPAIIAKFFDGGDSDIVRVDNYDGFNQGRVSMFDIGTANRSGGYIYGSANFGVVLGDVTSGNFNDLVNAFHPTALTTTFAPAYDNATSCGTSFYRWTAVWAVNGNIQTSDERQKENVQPISYGLNTLMKLNPVSYQWKDKRSRLGNGTNLGFLAQDLEKTLPDVIVHSKMSQEEIDRAKMKKGFDPSNTDSYGVKYSEMIPVLVKAIQELQAEIESLKMQIKTLQK